jgi:hypothetical protein
MSSDKTYKTPALKFMVSQYLTESEFITMSVDDIKIEYWEYKNYGTPNYLNILVITFINTGETIKDWLSNEDYDIHLDSDNCNSYYNQYLKQSRSKTIGEILK